MKTARNGGFTLIELLVMVAVMTLLAALLIPELAKSKERAQRIRCTSHLKEIGLSFKQWPKGSRDNYPMTLSTEFGGTKEWIPTSEVFRHFEVMSNELNSPQILVCPSDTERRPVQNFDSSLSNSNVSYFVGADAEDTSPQMFLAGDRNLTNSLGLRSGLVAWGTNEVIGWTHQMHRLQGNVVLADGSVQGFSTARLREAFQNTGVATNRLVLP